WRAPVAAETRILLLSSRDDDAADTFDEPPSRPPSPDAPWIAAPGPFASAVRADGVGPVASSILEALSDVPGLRPSHRSVARPSEVLAAVGDHRPDVVFNLCENLRGDSRLEVSAAWILDRLGVPFTGSPYFALRHCLYKLEANQILARA